MTLFRRIARRSASYLLLIILTAFSRLTQRPIIVILIPFGDIGNRLFLFANIIAFASEQNAIVIHAAFRPHRALFHGTRPGAIATFPSLPLPHFAGTWLESLIQELCWPARELASRAMPNGAWASLELEGEAEINLNHPKFERWFRSKKVVFVSGWLFIAKNSMQRQAERVRAYLKPILKPVHSDLAAFRQLKASCDIIIAVMMRHGDYRQWLQGKYFFPTATYIRWMREAQALFPGKKVAYLITGNDDTIPEGIDDLSFIFLPHSLPGTRHLLSQCDYIISTISTYAGWQAFWGDVPMFTARSSTDTITLEGFQRIHTQTDMRGSHFTDVVDITESVFRTSSTSTTKPISPD